MDGYVCPNRDGGYVKFPDAQVDEWTEYTDERSGNESGISRVLAREMRHLARIWRQHTLPLAKRLVWPCVDSPNILRAHEPGAA